ncbi:MAG: heavy-metal-associated domain-containing protein, partial [Hyphomicrobiales bacterium]|nr:heavy-metal-associated domain-containing protein [Hyphomicrobiales bacterium]
MKCDLCELPTPVPPIEADGHVFCCFGCKEVYRSFGGAALKTNLATAPSPAGDHGPPEHGREAFLRIDGMHCSSCEYLIARLAAEVDGVHSIASSYATSTARVVYDPDRISEGELPRALSRSGYRARLSRDSAPEYDYRLDLLRLLTGLVLWVVVMMLYVAFFYPAHLGL